MRSHVLFHHPAEFRPMPDEEGILSTAGATWFAQILKRVPGLVVDDNLCQEDWGVVVFGERDNKRFWIGLNAWFDDDRTWLAHVHHGSTAWLQRFSGSGKAAFQKLVVDIHHALANDSQVSGISWFNQDELAKPDANGAPTPSAT